MGDVGEDEAERHLTAQGYQVVERNYTCRGGEIDRVAWDGDTLCFVEIKARAGKEFGTAVEGISRAKQRRIVRAAQSYLMNHPTDAPCRFDVLALDLDNSAESQSADRGGPGRWKITLLRSAFELA